MSATFPHTAEVIEKFSIRVFNFQSLLEAARNKKRALPFDEEERLRKRERVHLIESGKQEKNAWHKVVSKSKRQHVLRAPEWPVVGAHKSTDQTSQNPYAVLLSVSAEDSTDQPLESAPQKEQIEQKGAVPVEEQPEEADEDVEEDVLQRPDVKERAKLEMEKWTQQEKEAQEEKERQEEQQRAAQRAAIERARKDAQEAKEKKLQEELKLREKEKHQAELAAQREQEERDNEALEKQLAHLKASQAHKAEKAARDVEMAKQRKREEIERAVQIALAQRAQDELAASRTPERIAENNAKQLIEEEQNESLSAEVESQESVEKDHAPKQIAKKKAAKHKAEPKESNRLTEKVMQEIKDEKKEVSVIGGIKIVDEHTNWVAHSDAEYLFLYYSIRVWVLQVSEKGGTSVLLTS